MGSDRAATAGQGTGNTGTGTDERSACLQGILFVPITGIGWEDLPQELGFGSGMTCWRRLRDWQTAGVFEAMHTAILAHCHRAGLIDFDRVIPDGSHVRAKRGRRHRAQPGRPPQDPERNTTS
ncbi:transposase [Nocardia puris]|uniref:transposase n=1 Tax=Nocardia puris TaxID=208602 RepID=UPI002E245AB5